MAGGAASALFSEAIILLGGAVIAAPLFKKMGLGTVLGYLAAGIVIGPLFRLITDPEQILQVSEFGVVFLLFIIGLELKPSRLWSLKRDIFGLGLAQVAITGLLLCAASMVLAGQSVNASLVIGFGLALSSTAFALQMLEDSGETNMPHGQKSFSILLFQDLAIVPMLAVVPLLAIGDAQPDSNALVEFAKAAAAVGALVLAGRYLLTPLFQIVGNTGAREAMIATALLVVLGAAYTMQIAGLSMAMGAFIAGVMLAESSYRHELEADIEPFRGLLLGLFFMAIGLSLDLAVLREQWLIILIAVPALMFSKFAIIFGLNRAFGSDRNTALRSAAVLPQGGEFGFVLFGAAVAAGIFDISTASLLIAIATLSMALTPISVMLVKRFEKEAAKDEMAEDFRGGDEATDVLMIGFSRFGQIASQALLSGGANVTIIDHSADRVQSARKFGFNIFFGDGTRREVLEAAGANHARIIAICTNKREITDKALRVIQQHWPQARIFVRSYDRAHTLELRAKDVEYELRETFESGLRFGGKTLEALGTTEYEAMEIIDDVRQRDEKRLRIQAAQGDLMAGRDMVRTRPVSPEPLSKPAKEGRVIKIDDKTHKHGANE